jgi:hypothetical protein
MPQNFIACDRDQELLLPPNLKEWLPENHLARFVLSSVEEVGLAPFYASYRGDGHGRAAHELTMRRRLLSHGEAAAPRPVVRPLGSRSLASRAHGGARAHC